MRRDILGNVTTLGSTRAALAWDETMDSVLAHSRRTPDALNEVLTHDPHFAQAHAVKGLMLMTLARGELVAAAGDCLAKAKSAALLNPPTARENAFIEALHLWLQGEIDKAADRLETITRDHPFDTMAIKFAHAIRFMMGDQTGMLRGIDSVAGQFNDDTPFAGYIFGCRSFALEENGYYEDAEHAGRRAVKLAPRDAWGLHAVAHVLEMNGRAEEGYHWLDRANHYEHCNNFGNHIHWHRALFAIELGRTGDVLDLHDQAIRHERTDDFRDIANGASLLQRLELEGVDVGSRWDELADIAARRVGDRRLVFADLHYLLALLGAHRFEEARLLVTSLAKDGQQGGVYDRRVAGETGMHIAQGLMDFAAGNYHSAADNLMRGREMRQSMGGSHAQRDVFEQTTLEALLRAGDLERAEKILKGRIAARHGNNRFASARLARLSCSRDQATRVGAMLVETAPASTHH